MKRDFLEAFGLNKADIDAILAENGKHLDALRQQYRVLEEERAKWEEEKAALETQRQTAEEELARLRQSAAEADRFREAVINGFVSEAKPASTLAEREIRRQLNETAKDGGDPREALARLKSDDPGAFCRDEEPERPIFASFTRDDNLFAETMPAFAAR